MNSTLVWEHKSGPVTAVVYDGGFDGPKYVLSDGRRHSLHYPESKTRHGAIRECVSWLNRKGVL